MNSLPPLFRVCTALAIAAITGLGSAQSLAATYTYLLWSSEATQPIYPDVSWLPDPYKPYYEKDSIEDTVKLFLASFHPGPPGRGRAGNCCCKRGVVRENGGCAGPRPSAQWCVRARMRVWPGP